MKSLQLYSFILSFALLFACKEKYNGPTIAEGQVVDEITGRPVPFAVVELLRNQKASWTGLGLAKIDEQFTQEDGRFSFTLEETSDEYIYYLSASEDHYFSSAPDVNVEVGKKSENMHLPITPKGWIRYRVINEPPIEKIHSITISNVPSIAINYDPLDTTIFGHGRGGSIKQIAYWIHKEGSDKIRYNDSIYLKPLDTVEYVIKY